MYKTRAENYFSVYKELKEQLKNLLQSSVGCHSLKSSHWGIKTTFITGVIKLYERDVFPPLFTATLFLCSYLMVIVTSISLSVTIVPRTWCRTAVSVSILGEDL